MDDEIIREFLLESNEGLARLEHEMLELEKQPDDADLLASVFRTIHTIKGTCGFLGFDHLRRITHIAEHILSQLRERELSLSAYLVSLILETADAIKAVLETIGATGTEGRETYGNLCARLKRASEGGKAATAAACSVSAARSVQDAPRLERDLLSPTSQPHQAKLLNSELSRNSDAPIPGPDRSTSQSEGPTGQAQTVRVDVLAFDRLISLAGELSTVNDAIVKRANCCDDPALRLESQRLTLLASQLNEALVKARMQRMNVLCGKLRRLVRHLSNSCGKQIALELEGIETELDKAVIDAVSDPLTHIVRNACDHGIEEPDIRVSCGKPPEGKLSFRVFHENGSLIIEVKDDGRGIDIYRLQRRALENGIIDAHRAASMTDTEALQLVWLPGVSTAEQISTISGRGVGMDVVKTNVETLGGRVSISTKAGRGTTIRIVIPASPLLLSCTPGKDLMRRAQ